MVSHTAFSTFLCFLSIQITMNILISTQYLPQNQCYFRSRRIIFAVGIIFAGVMAPGHGRKHQDLPCDIKWKVEISLEFLPYEEISFHRRKYIEKLQLSIWPVHEFCPHHTLLRCVALEKLFNLSEPLYLSNNDDNYNFKNLL